MIKSRVYILFECFSAKERRAFKKFVRSPFHNVRDDARLLYEYLLENHRKKALLDRKLVFKACFVGEKFDDAKFRQVLAQVSRLMEEYLAIDQLMQDEVNVKLLSAKSLKDKKLSAMASSNLVKAELLLSKSDFRSSSYYESRSQILSELHLIAASIRDKPVEMTSLNEALEVSFIIEKLMRSCYILSHQNVVKSDHVHGMTNALITYIEEGELLRVDAVRLFYYAYQVLLPDAEEQWFYKLKDQLSSFGNFFPNEELHLLFMAAINYAVKKLNSGQQSYVKELFLLYKFGLTNDLFMLNGELSRFTYKNINTISLKLNEFEWSEWFIHQYKKHLSPECKDSYFSYNRSNLHYSLKEYDSALRLLIRVEYDDLFLSLDAKLLLLKIYFETKEWDALDSLLASFKTFLYRKEIMAYHKDNYQNIIDLTRKLSTIGLHNRKEIRTVKKLVEKTKPNTEQKWMLERIGEL